MDSGKFAKYGFCALVLFLGAWYSKPPTLKQVFEKAGFHPHLNHSESSPNAPVGFVSMDPKYEYTFENVSKDQLVNLLKKSGYRIVFESQGLIPHTNMIRMNMVFTWRVDDSLELIGMPTDVHFPTQITLLRVDKKL